MNRYYRSLFLSVLLAGSLACQALTLPIKKNPAPTPAPTTPEMKNEAESPGETPSSSAVPLSETCTAAVDGIYSLRSGLDFPPYFQQENPLKQGGEFDPNRYFDILTRLQMEPGYTLDYAYRYDGMGGGPLLYARKVDEEPFKTAAELQAAFDTGEKVDPDKPSFGWNEQYLSHVRVDGSPEGYLEFTTLAISGGQFYLFWHSNYNDTVILCSPDLMKYAVEELKGFQIELPPEVQAAAKKIDFTPTIRVENDSVTVRLVTFTKWGGFAEEVYVLDRAQPSHLLELRSTPLVDYNCGIMF